MKFTHLGLFSRRPLFFILIVPFLIFRSLQVQAQDTVPDKTIDQLFDLNLDEFFNLVVTPSKIPQKENNVTQKVDVLKGRDIETRVLGNQNLCELISAFPGSSVTVLSRNDANWGTYGGIGTKYNTYLLQGLPIDGFIDPMSLDINILDHVEIQRGPASIIYPNFLSNDFAGVQSPLTGTINFIYKEKIEDPATIYRFSAGSYNTITGQILSQQRKGSWNYFGGVSYEKSDYTNYGSANSWLNMQDDPDYLKTRIYGGITVFPDKSERQKMTLFVQRTNHTGDVGRIYRNYENQYTTANAGYSISIRPGLFFQSNLGVRIYDRNWQESEFRITDSLTSVNGVHQNITPADISFVWNQTPKITATFGGDYQGAYYEIWNDPLTGYHRLITKAVARQTGVYAQEEWHPHKNLLIRAGVRFTYLANSLSLVNSKIAGQSKQSWDKLLWSTGIRYTISKKLNVYANGGSSYASPGFKSTNGTLVKEDFLVPGKNGQLPNPGLRPENGTGLDAGLEFFTTRGLGIDVRLFYTVIRDAIIDNIVSRNPSQMQSINAESSSKGAELEITHKLSASILWYANATYLLSNISNDSTPDQDNVEIPLSPSVICNTGLTFSTQRGFKFVPEINYNGGFYDATSKSDRIKYTPGLLVNAYVSQRFLNINTTQSEFFARFYNITNNRYQLPWQFKNTGFSLMCGIKVTFR